MSTERDVCPYFRGEGLQVIHCTGVEPAVNADVTFQKHRDFKDYRECFCLGKYSACAMAKCLDEVYRTCSYNSGVICLQTDNCSKCGWNPEVSSRRLSLVKKQLAEKEAGRER